MGFAQAVRWDSTSPSTDDGTLPTATGFFPSDTIPQRAMKWLVDSQVPPRL